MDMNLGAKGDFLVGICNHIDVSIKRCTGGSPSIWKESFSLGRKWKNLRGAWNTKMWLRGGFCTSSLGRKGGTSLWQGALAYQGAVYVHNTTEKKKKAWVKKRKKKRRKILARRGKKGRPEPHKGLTENLRRGIGCTWDPQGTGAEKDS